MMNKKTLEDYRFKLIELQRLERGQDSVTDTVSGSSSDFPYTKHPITVKGIPQNATSLADQLRQQCAEIEAFISSLPNSYYRNIFRMRIAEGKEWEEIGEILNKSEGAVKMAYKRAIENLN